MVPLVPWYTTGTAYRGRAIAIPGFVVPLGTIRVRTMVLEYTCTMVRARVLVDSILSSRYSILFYTTMVLSTMVFYSFLLFYRLLF